MRLILDVGSTHGGKEMACYKAIDRAVEIGLKDLKFQLLEKQHCKCGNIPIDRRWLPGLIAKGRKNGINVFASVWSLNGMKDLLDSGATTIKFAYSAHGMTPLIETAMTKFAEVIVSTDVMSFIPGPTNLFCVPEYPVYQLLSFEGLFPRFRGFSDHTMGIKQTETAIHQGAKIIEKHVIADPTVQCPDAKFAIDWREVQSLINYWGFEETA